MIREDILQNEKLGLKLISSFHSSFSLYGLFPHSHEFPFLELFEEFELLNTVVGVSFNEPLTK
jgi:hypothetical protein